MRRRMVWTVSTARAAQPWPCSEGCRAVIRSMQEGFFEPCPLQRDPHLLGTQPVTVLTWKPQWYSLSGKAQPLRKKAESTIWVFKVTVCPVRGEGADTMRYASPHEWLCPFCPWGPRAQAGGGRWEDGERKQQGDGRMLSSQETDLRAAPTWPWCKGTCIESSRIQVIDLHYRWLVHLLHGRNGDTEENGISQDEGFKWHSQAWTLRSARG